MGTQNIRLIVRLANKDLDGTKKLCDELRKIKGIGYNLARGIVIASGFDLNVKLGELSDDELEKLKDVIKDPVSYGVCPFMLNRQKDLTTGENLHLIASDLDLKMRENLNLLKKIKCYRGIRHMFGLPCRGQRTKSTFRKGAVVGVMRKKTKQAMAKKQTKSTTKKK
jgi:small subunit ribosomal protein S13